VWEKIKGIDLALYIFLLTGLGYLVTFLYEWGYNNYFLLPIDFIDLSIANITKSVIMVGMIFCMFIIYNMFLGGKTDANFFITKILLPNKKLTKTYNLILQSLCVIGEVGMVYLWLNNANNPLKIVYLFIALLLLYFYCCLKKYKLFAIIAIMIILLFLPYIIGIDNAKNKDEYLLINGTNDLVIKSFGNMVISAKYNKEKNTLYPEYTFTSLESLEKDKKQLKLIYIENINISKAPHIER
jgi:hypothetical protein